VEAEQQNDILLKANNLHTWFDLRQWGFLRIGSVRAVDGVDFELARGEAVAFVGKAAVARVPWRAPCSGCTGPPAVT